MKLVLVTKFKYDYPILLKAFITEESQTPVYSLNYSEFDEYRECIIGDMLDESGLDTGKVHIFEMDLEKKGKSDIRDFIESLGVYASEKEKED